jgi:biopolymer transport protein TolR
MAGGIVKTKYGRRRGFTPMAEINVTPFVDVMLVLLVIFMVTAPLLTVGVPVDLPQSDAPAINEQSEPLVISIDASGKFYLQETPITAKDLIPRLRAITKKKSDQRIYVRGDKKIAYGKVMEVMSIVSAAGFDKVALVAEMPGGATTDKKDRGGN